MAGGSLYMIEGGVRGNCAFRTIELPTRIFLPESRGRIDALTSAAIGVVNMPIEVVALLLED